MILEKNSNVWIFLLEDSNAIPPPPHFCSESLGRLTGPSLGECLPGHSPLMPPRGSPIGGGGNPRLWGCGGDSPHDILTTLYGSSGPIQSNLREVRPRPGHFPEMIAPALHHDQPPQPPKKSVTSLPPLCTPQKNRSDRSISKSVGVTTQIPVSQHVLPLEVQTRQGDRSDRFQNRSVRPVSEMVGATISTRGS